MACVCVLHGAASGVNDTHPDSQWGTQDVSHCWGYQLLSAKTTLLPCQPRVRTLSFIIVLIKLRHSGDTLRYIIILYFHLDKKLLVWYTLLLG